MLEAAKETKFSAVWINDETLDRPWHIPRTPWAPAKHDGRAFWRFGFLAKTPHGRDANVIPCSTPEQTKGMFVITRTIQMRAGNDEDAPSLVWLRKEIRRYTEAGLRPILVWDQDHPMYAFQHPLERWYPWLSLFHRIAFLTEGEAVIAQCLNDLQSQERTSGEDQGPTTPRSGTQGSSRGMRMGSGGGSFF